MSDVAENVVTQTVEAPRKLRLLLICALSIAVAATPLVAIRQVNIANRSVLLFALTTLSSHFLMLATVLLFTRTGTVGDLNIVWWQRRRSEIRWTILLILGSVLGSAAPYWVMRVLGFVTESGVRLPDDQASVPFFLACAIDGALLTPIVEEIFWRGYVQRMFERVGGGFLAVVGQAILFAATHMRPLGGSADLFVFGLIAGTWRWKRRTLLPIIFAHMIGNTLYCIAHWPDWVDLTQVRPTVDYVAQMNELSRPTEYNAADDASYDYGKALQLAVKMPDEIDKFRKRYPTDSPQEVREAARKWVDANAQALEHLVQGAKKPYYRPVYAGKNATEASLPPLEDSRALALVLATRIKLDAYEQKEESLVSDTVALYRFGSHLGGQKPLVHQLVSVGLQDLTIRTVRDVLAHESLSLHTLDELQSQFESFAEDPNFTMDFAIERLVSLDSIQTAFTDEGNGRGHIPELTDWDDHEEIGLRADRKSFVTKKELLTLDRRWTVDCIEEFFDEAQKAAKKTPWQFRHRLDTNRLLLISLLRRNAFLRIWGQSCFQSLELPWRTHTSIEALVALLATLRYEEDLGQWPESLQQLVEAGYLERVPLDCYSDGPLIYKRTTDGFLLYSVGSDFDDDGGTPSKWGEGKEGGDQVFWPVRDQN